MKRAWALLFLVLSIGGCDAGDGDDWQIPPVERLGFGEADLNDANARPGLHHARAFQLEATGTHAGDTGGPGVDRGALFVDAPTRHLFCFEDLEGVAHRMRILDGSGTTLLDLAANDCEAVDLAAGEYVQEFEHGRRGEEGALPVPILIQPVEDAAEAQAAVRSTGRMRSGLAPSCGTTNCTVTKVPYASLNLAGGQVALFPTQCPPQPADEVWVFGGSCPDTGIAKVRGVHLGPWTQTVVYDATGFTGSMHGFGSRIAKEACIPDDGRAGGDGHSSLRVIPTDSQALEPCEVVSGGYYCTGCKPPFTGSVANTPAGRAAETLPTNVTGSYTPPVQGQVLVHGDAPAGSCCPGVLVLRGACPDLGLFGLDKSITTVVLPEQTSLDLFGDPAFGGTKTELSTPGEYVLLAPDGFHTGKGEASSLVVDTWKGINRATLVSTSRCTGCNLQGANLAGFDSGGVAVQLASADLTGADLTGAQIPGANMAGAILRAANLSRANLKGAVLTGALLGEVRNASGKVTLGAATLDGAWMEDAMLDGHADLAAVRARGTYLYAGTAGTATVATSTLRRADFTGAVLKGLNLRGAMIAGATFHQADLTKATLSAVTASDATEGPVDFGGASLQGADLTGTDYDRADFSGALLNTSKATAMVRMVQGVGTDTAGNLAYVPQYRTFTCDPQIPDRLPKSTSAATTCPDGALGPCTGHGGESGAACPTDCPSGSQCTSTRHCVAADWPAATGPGHWTCRGAVCTAVSDPAGCGDRKCDADGGETPASCPADCALDCQDPSHCWALAWSGTAPGNWVCSPDGKCAADPQPLFCGDGICLDFVGESAASCPADCGSEAACDGTANRCLNLRWTQAGCQGRWTCDKGACTATCDAVQCGNGTCDWTEGESPRSCPRDCVAGGCTQRAHCTGRPWPAGVCPGHWNCRDDRICEAICEDNTCGDGRCDRDGRWIRP